jgi:hypothetical protein
VEPASRLRLIAAMQVDDTSGSDALKKNTQEKKSVEEAQKM